MKLVDLTGQRFGRLIVKQRAEDYITPKGKRYIQWYCLCDCGNEVIVQGNNLKSGKTQSCGCIRSELITKPRKKKGNIYNLSGEYGIGYTSKGQEFYFDLEDYEKIKDYTWHITSTGYVASWNIGFMHKYIMQIQNDNILIDHIHGTKNDNRKNNLRIVNYSKNAMNVRLRANNTSGVTGVYYSKNENKWRAFISINGKKTYVGYYDNFEDAVIARKEAEKKYYKKYAYDYSQKV